MAPGVFDVPASPPCRAAAHNKTAETLVFAPAGDAEGRARRALGFPRLRIDSVRPR